MTACGSGLGTKRSAWLNQARRRGRSRSHTELLQRLLVQAIIQLDFGSCQFAHLRLGQAAVERAARALLVRHDPAGALWLADKLRRWGYSYADRTLTSTRAFSADLYARYLPRLIARQDKSAFDCYTLGLEYQSGTRTGRDLARSRQLFRRAMAMGFSLAAHEWIISTMIDERIAPAEKEHAFASLRGLPAKDSRQAHVIFRLSALPAAAAADPHARMRELLAAWTKEVYSTVGKHYLNLRVEACFRDYVTFTAAQRELSADGHFTLAKVAEASRLKPTGAPPVDHYRAAARLGHLEAAEYYVVLTPETDRPAIEQLIRAAFGGIPPTLCYRISDRFDNMDRFEK